MKNWIKGANATVISLAVVGIFIVLTIFLHSLKGTQIDLTANKKFTLAESTVTTVKQLDKPVHAIIFNDPGQDLANRQITDLLDEYHKLNSKFTYESVDPKKNPTTAEKYKIDHYGVIVFESGDQTKTVDSSELFGQGSDQTSYTFSGEEKFTQAIQSLTSTEKHHVYLLTGHGEFTSAKVSTLTTGLENENFTVSDLNLVKDGKIPDDAEALFILAPQNDLSDKEAELVQSYLKGKGKLMFALSLEKGMADWKNFNSILAIYGVKNAEALAIDTKRSLATDPLVVVPEYGSHDITNKLSEQNRVTVLPAALALTSYPNNQDWHATALLKTSDQAYGKTNLDTFTSSQGLTQNDIKKTDKDLKGPLDLAYAITDKDNKPRAVILSGGLLVQDEFITQQGNRDFVLNSVGWLQEQKNLVTIRPREDSITQAVLTPGQQRSVFWLSVIVYPILFLLAGGFVWWRRRKG